MNVSSIPPLLYSIQSIIEMEFVLAFYFKGLLAYNLGQNITCIGLSYVSGFQAAIGRVVVMQ